jgi:PAS domain S-box-containing protein
MTAKPLALIVDDKEENRYYLRTLVAAYGYEVDSAAQGAEALAKARHSPPSLVISDLLMPVMDGYTLLRHWKLDKKLKHIPFIVYTATYTAPEDERLALDLGADAFIVKPMEPDQLMTCIRQAHSNVTDAGSRFTRTPSASDQDIVKQYSATLVRKLEEKTIQLEAANRALQREMAERERMALVQTGILNALPAHVALLDSNGLILEVNDPWRRFATVNGLQSADFAVGANYLQICDNAEGSWRNEARAVAAGVRRVLAGAASEFSLEYPDHLQQQKRWFRLIVTSLRQFERSGGVVTHVNITEAKLADEKSRRDAERLALAVNAASIGIWEWEPTTNQIVWDDRMYGIYGQTAGTPITVELWSSHLQPDDAATQSEALQGVIGLGEKDQREFRIITRSGELRHIYAAKKLLSDSAGGVSSVVGINWDITQRKFDEASVKEVSTRLETLVEQANIGILVHRDFKPIMANSEMARIFGYGSKDEIQNMPDCRVLFADSEQARIAAYDRDRLRGGDIPGFYSIKGKRGDGAIIDLEIRAFAIQWGDRSAVCSMLSDATEQRQIEAQLRQSQRLEAVGQMTGGIAHDFNNVLTVIIANTELMEETDDPFLRRLAEMSRKAAERGAELTSRLLAFSRQQPLDPKAIDINALIAKMFGLIRRAIGDRLEIETRFDDNLWHAFVDPSQLENALLNLAINARDAMPDGGRLTIETRNIRKDDAAVADQAGFAPEDYLLVAVSDTGTGMDNDTLAHAFEPFFTTKEVGKGSGLGLSMVYGFVKQSRGHTLIDSKLGRGTTVNIYLPRAADDAALAMEEIRDGSLLRGREKILLVEDDAMVRDTVMIQLRNLGYLVASATGASEALELLEREGGFDLLLTDVVMPGGLNGRELADEARKIRPGLPVIFTSGYAENAVVHGGHVDPGVHLLSKPYRRSDLALKIRSVLAPDAPFSQ